MNRNEVNLFEDLDPPPGGKERFRQWLNSGDASTRPQAIRGARPGLASPLASSFASTLAAVSAVAGVAALSVVAIIAVVAVLRFGDDTGGSLANESTPRLAGIADAGTAAPVNADVYASREFDRLLGRPMQRIETSIVIDGERVAVAEIPSGRSKIRIYQIENN